MDKEALTKILSALTDPLKDSKANRKLVSVNIVSVGTHRNRLNDEVSSHKTELKASVVTSAAKTNFVKSLKGRTVTQKVFLGKDRKRLEKKLVKATPMPKGH